MKPILFSTPMVQALLENRKTQTRRIPKCFEPINLVPDNWYVRSIDNALGIVCFARRISHSQFSVKLPYCVGDRLWCRETWRVGAWHEDKGIAVDYKADNYCRKEWLAVDNGELFERLWRESTDEASEVYGFKSRYKWEAGQSPCHWRPSIFMPRWASRITLEITDIRVERLNTLNVKDAISEGMEAGKESPSMDIHPIYLFSKLWDSINGKKYTWADNPFVWVISFKAIIP